MRANHANKTIEMTAKEEKARKNIDRANVEAKREINEAYKSYNHKNNTN